MVTKNCIVCKKEFKCYPAAAKRRKTCSKECGYEIQKAEHKKLKSCLNCGKETTNPKYCSSKCHGEHLNVKCIGRDKELFEQGLLTSRFRIKPLLEQRDGWCCSSCKLTTWLDKPITLWVDHIDGDATNNNQTNLRLICPNCDSQSDTFMAKNKGNGRKSRGLKPWQ